MEIKKVVPTWTEIKSTLYVEVNKVQNAPDYMYSYGKLYTVITFTFNNCMRKLSLT